MSCVIVVGTQWGDEGKGKIVDLLTEHADVVVRFQGGNNAGHTLVVNGEQFILHLIPSGILHADKQCLIGNGVVLDLEVLHQEVTRLRERGVRVGPENLAVSEKAHLILPYHRHLDLAREAAKGKQSIGTTGRGIGPCYEDKVARVGVRMADLLDEPVFRQKVEENLKEKNFLFERWLNVPPLNPSDIGNAFLPLADFFRSYVTDVSLRIDETLQAGKKVLFEGAQGTHLDVDHGTYPYVTSSNPVAGSACAGAGVGPTKFKSVVGIVKAYTTRVGGGPFPAELTDDIGLRLRETGGEYGATTGRPRRCGWLDTVVLRDSARLNGLTGIALTKLDVLSGLKTLKICTAYTEGDRVHRQVPARLQVLEKCRPVYEEMEGWEGSLSGIRRVEDLPPAARRYIDRIRELTQVPIDIISVGPGREETLMLGNPFAG